MLKKLTKKISPNRIKSLKELNHGFRPRWYRMQSLGFAASCVWLLIGFVLAIFFGMNAFVLTFMLACAIPWVTVLIVFDIAPKTLNFLGYWFPKLSLLAAQFDEWSERELDWEVGR